MKRIIIVLVAFVMLTVTAVPVYASTTASSEVTYAINETQPHMVTKPQMENNVSFDYEDSIPSSEPVEEPNDGFELAKVEVTDTLFNESDEKQIEEPEVTEPNTTESETTESEVAEPEATEPETTESEATEPETKAEVETPAVESHPVEQETVVKETKEVPNDPANYTPGKATEDPASHNIVCEGSDDSHMVVIEGFAEMLPEEIWMFFCEHDWTVLVEDNLTEYLEYGDHHVLGLCSYKRSTVFLDNSAAGSAGIVHEIGHFVDEFWHGYHYGDKASSCDEFEAIWAEEAQNIATVIVTAPNNYATPVEFFAEAFRCYFLYNDELKAACPKAYAYVAQTLETFMVIAQEEEVEKVAEETVEDETAAATETVETETTSDVVWPPLEDPEDND